MSYLIPQKFIEVTQAEYDALTPAQVEQTAIYLVKGTTSKNPTSYVGKNFGESKPLSLLSSPIYAGNGGRAASATYGNASINWVQASPVDSTKFYFATNSGGASPAALWVGSLAKDTGGIIYSSSNSFPGEQALTYSIFAESNGGGIYDASTVFLPDEKYSAGDSSKYGRIVKVDLSTGAASDAWNFFSSTPTVSRADISSSIWNPDDLIVDRANNKLFVSSSYASVASEGSSVARFSINPTTKALAPDSWVKAVTTNGSSSSSISRLVMLPDGYVFVVNYNWSSTLLTFQTFNGYGSAAGNGASINISFPVGHFCSGAAFRADTNAPSGIGYILIAPRTGSLRGNVYAYDYQGNGVVNTTAVDSVNLSDLIQSAKISTNPNNLEVGSMSVGANGSILVGTRTNSGSAVNNMIPSTVTAYNWIPLARSGTMSVQNSDAVNITGGSINGVKNLIPKVELFTAPGTKFWYKDPLAKYVRIQAWGAGGGGGSGMRSSFQGIVRGGGGGGAGGGYADALIDARYIGDAQQENQVNVGTGGNGGDAIPLTTFSISTAVAVSNNVTVTTTTTHTLPNGGNATVAGVVGGSGINGTFNITGVSSNTFTYTSGGATGSGTGGTATRNASGNAGFPGSSSWFLFGGSIALVSASTTSTVVTLVTSDIHNIQVGVTVSIAGITGGTGYNGDFVVTAVGSKSISYNSVSSGTGSGGTATVGSVPITAAGGGGGGGGVGPGAAGGTSVHNGNTGASSSSTGTAGSVGGSAFGGGPGGGSGGGVSTSNSSSPGGAGGVGLSSGIAGGTAGVPGATPAGGAGTKSATGWFGSQSGGGGGAAVVSLAGGIGGAGGIASGGGGGGARQDNASGAGGKGGDGLVIITTYY